ncbi:hypothetical protein ANO14919_049620 [Xylariales sp. No.14919]|nr:hypothetical protein ANO14919_049620 [Xylariales sp. No.14919]
MPPKLRLQTPPFYPLSLDLAAPPRISFTLTNNRGPSELQQKLNAVVKRVVGEDTYPSSPYSPPSSDDNDDDDTTSHYGEDAPIAHHASTDERSILSPSSYTSLASLNPYSVAPEDLAQHLSPSSPSPPGAERGTREDRHKQEEARLAQQLDRAHAAVVAEEDAALRVLRQQTRLAA